MKYSVQLMEMANEIRALGFEVAIEYFTAYIKNTPIAFETSSITNIYMNNQVIYVEKDYKKALEILKTLPQLKEVLT